MSPGTRPAAPRTLPPLLLAGNLVQTREELGLAREHPVAPDPVDRPVPRGRHEPRRRVARHSVARPSLESRRHGVLESVLGKLEIAEDRHQRGEDAATFLAEDARELVYSAPPDVSITGRTSIEPTFADGILAAQSSASSSESTSIR